MNFGVEVQADNSGQWTGNAIVLATREEAEAYGLDLYSRWTAVKEWRVVQVDKPVSYRFILEGNVGRLISLTGDTLKGDQPSLEATALALQMAVNIYCTIAKRAGKASAAAFGIACGEIMMCLDISLNTAAELLKGELDRRNL